MSAAADLDGPRVPAWKRLRALPPVFNIFDVELQTGATRRGASNFCAKWRTAGLVTPVGEDRAGVFYNLVADPSARETRRVEAVAKAWNLPVVVVGAAALGAHGWTTQMAHRIELAVPVRRGVRFPPDLAGFETAPRYVRWFAKILSASPQHGEGDSPSVSGFRVAPPEWALADALLASHRGRRSTWVPAPDDVEIPDEEALERVRSALLALGASPQEADEALEGYEPAGSYGMSF